MSERDYRLIVFFDLSDRRSHIRQFRSGTNGLLPVSDASLHGSRGGTEPNKSRELSRYAPFHFHSPRAKPQNEVLWAEIARFRNLVPRRRCIFHLRLLHEQNRFGGPGGDSISTLTTFVRTEKKVLKIKQPEKILVSQVRRATPTCAGDIARFSLRPSKILTGVRLES